jgi:CCR4-NOT transcription complex subunit 7/8
MMASFDGLYGGLAALADSLEVQRIGPMHQAGSDSLLTSQAYFAFVEKYSNGVSSGAFDNSKFMGELFGIGNAQNKFKKYGSYNDFSGAQGQGGSSFPHSTSTSSLLSSAASSKRGMTSVASYSALDSANGGFGE